MDNKKKGMSRSLLGVGLFIAIATAVVLWFYMDSMPSSANLIPKDTMAVATFSLANMSKKADLEKNLDRFYEISGQERTDDFDVDLLIEAINPLASMFLYSYMDDDSMMPYFCFSMDVSDKEKFAEFVKKTSSSYDLDWEIKDKDNYSYGYKERGDYAMAWDDDKALIIWTFSDLDTDQIATLFSLKEEEKVLSDPQFEDFYFDRGDVSFWFNSDPIVPMLEYAISGMGMMGMDDELMSMIPEKEYWENSSGALNIFFNTDGIKTEFVSYDNEKMTKINETIFADADFESDILTYVPGKSLVSFSMAMDLQALNESEAMDLLWEGFEEGSEMSEKDFKSGLKQEMNLEWDKLIAAIGGSVVINFSGMDGRAPELTFATNHYDEELISQVMKEFVDLGLFENYGDYYMIDENPPLYIAYNENTIVGSFDKGVIKKVKNEDGLENNLSNTDIGGKMDDNLVYAHMNLNLSDWPEEVGEEMRPRRRDDRRIFNRAEKMFESIELSCYDYNQADLNLNMNVGDSPNSLEAFIDFGLDEFKKEMDRYRN